MKTNIQLQSWLRRAAVLLITLAGCLPIVAQEEEIEGGEAFYIYRNDGHFDGFFYDQVKQIRYSRLDTLGIEHDRYVSQEIVTEDSVYRIMLTAIDSVSYVQPEIRYAKETRFMADEGMMAYYLSISKPSDDRFLLRFSGSMPAALQPKVGDVLCCPNLKDYEEAFVGKVKKVHSEGGEIQVECGYIEDLSEVFEQFVTVEQIRQVQTENGTRASRRIAGFERQTRADGNWEDITIFNIAVHPEESFDLFLGTKVNLGADISFAAVANAVYKIKGWRDFYLKAEIKPQVGLNINVSIDGQIGGKPISLKSLPGLGDLFNKIKRIPFPTICPVLYIDVVPEPFIRGEAHLNFAMNTSPIIKALGIGIELKSEFPFIVPSAGLISSLIIPQAVFLVPVGGGGDLFKLSAEIDGMAQIGLKSPIKLGTMDWLKFVADAETESTLYAGPKLEGKFPLSTQMRSNTIFENLKEAELNFTTLSLDLEFSAKGKILKWNKEAKETYNFSLLKYPMKAFPEIDIDKIKVDIYGERKNNVRVSYGTKGNVFFPQMLGVGIYTKADEKDNEYRKLYKKDFRYEGYFMNTFNNVELTFEDLEAGEYLVCPIIRPNFPLIPTDDDGLIPAYKGANFASGYDKQKRKFTVALQDLVLTPSEIQAEEEGGEFSIEVQTGFDTPIIPESLEKWIKAEIVTGSDKSNTLKLTVDENQTDAFRTGLVFVRQQRSDNDVAEKMVTVKQYGGLELSQSKLEFTKEGGELTIDILTSYKPITIALGDAKTWLSYSLDDRKLIINAVPNQGGNRTATIIISAFSKKKNRNVEVKLTITQKGLVDASIEPTELNFDVDGGTLPVYVAVGNDTEFTGVSVRDKSDTWVTVEKMTSIFNVTVKPNEDEKRTAYVDATFKAKDKDGKTYTVTLPVAITQKGIVQASVMPSELLFDKGGGDREAAITKGDYSYCGAWVEDSAKDWLSVAVKDKGEYATLIATATENKSGEDRSGEITVYFSTVPNPQEEDMTKVTIKVTQKGKAEVIIQKIQSVSLSVHAYGYDGVIEYDCGKFNRSWSNDNNKTEIFVEHNASVTCNGAHGTLTFILSDLNVLKDGKATISDIKGSGDGWSLTAEGTYQKNNYKEEKDSIIGVWDVGKITEIASRVIATMGRMEYEGTIYVTFSE